VSAGTTARHSIGTLAEKPLHAALKRWCSEPGDVLEVPVDGFVVDLVRSGLLVEIQTCSFSALKRKLTRLLAGHSVRVVYPIALETRIVKVGASGRVISSRRSPRRGTPVDLFHELVSFPELVAHPGLTLEVLLIRQEEVRRVARRRRRGWFVAERRLLEVVERLRIDSPEDLAALLPTDLPTPFTTADLAVALRRSRSLAQQMAYCLRRAGVLDCVGKRRNALTYARAAPVESAFR
jgi:hypothetical protein